MDEQDKNIRDSVLGTLTFLASPDAQHDFASKVYYASYQTEFACWWFDTFLPPNSDECFTANELPVLKEFSSHFDQLVESIGDGTITIGELLANETWREVISAAKHACTALALHA